MSLTEEKLPFIRIPNKKYQLQGKSKLFDSTHFCEMNEKNWVAFGVTNWARHSIDMDSATLQDAFGRLKSFCKHHSNTIGEASPEDVNGIN
ncbi:hypothetical protein YC2023_001582 [Brassica napus]